MNEEFAIALPELLQVSLRHFTLYALREEVLVPFDRPVVCLVGANGLGKSTFLAAVTFGLIGRVPEPGRKFDSADEYFRHSAGYSGQFFAGRIDESDRERAEIELHFQVRGKRFEIIRNPFEVDGLRRLYFDGEEVQASGPGALNQRYMNLMIGAVGLADFSQLFFLQAMLLTFDERRHLLFWDTKVLEKVMYLVFGLDPSIAEKADALRRTVEKRGSLARNAKWRSSEALKRLREIDELSGTEPETDELRSQREEFASIQARVEELRSAVERNQAELGDTALASTKLAAQRTALESQFQQIFEQDLAASRRGIRHPVIADSLDEGSCAICGSEHIEVLRQHVEAAQSCPLCRTPFPETPTKDVPPELVDTDARLERVRVAMADTQAKYARLAAQLRDLREKLDAATEKERTFASLNQHIPMLGALPTDDRLAELREAFKLQSQKALETSRLEYSRRDQAKKELAQFHRQLRSQYQSVETEFVPHFKKLARLFLGLDLDVRLDFSAKAARIGLVLEIRDSARRSAQSLSESQRFFVDIALRMALTHVISRRSEQPAALYIDTPEGSLDIAYEARAGEMFAQFAEQNSRIFLTANINSSQLLLRLGERCGHANMSVRRMTGWTILSDVQAEEEVTFDRAFAAISEALGSHALSLDTGE